MRRINVNFAEISVRISTKADRDEYILELLVKGEYVHDLNTEQYSLRLNLKFLQLGC